MTTVDRIVKLSRQLLPTGRVWKMANENYMFGLFRSLAQTKGQFYDDAMSLMDSILPDNPRFTEADATDWERRLRLPSNALIPLAYRMAAIRRKMAQPGTQQAKGHYLYLERQLQAAGFNVWVHENKFPLYPSGFESVAPNSLYGNGNFVDIEYNDVNYGAPSYGAYYNNLIVNSIIQEEDNMFNLGGSFRRTIFIGGQTLGTYASVLATREKEFRQLILSQKQVQVVGFLFINYI